MRTTIRVRVISAQVQGRRSVPTGSIRGNGRLQDTPEQSTPGMGSRDRDQSFPEILTGSCPTMDGVRAGARFNPDGYPAVVDHRYRSRFTRLPRHWRERPDHARRYDLPVSYTHLRAHETPE